MAVCPACLNPLGKQFVFELSTESIWMMRRLDSLQLVEMNSTIFSQSLPSLKCLYLFDKLSRKWGKRCARYFLEVWFIGGSAEDTSLYVNATISTASLYKGFKYTVFLGLG